MIAFGWLSPDYFPNHLQFLLHQNDAQQMFCPSPPSQPPTTTNSINLPPSSPAVLIRAFLIPLFHFTVNGPIQLGHCLLVSVPLTLLTDKLFATIFYKHYERGQRFRWLAIVILCAQVNSPLCFLFVLFRVPFPNKNNKKTNKQTNTPTSLLLFSALY